MTLKVEISRDASKRLVLSINKVPKNEYQSLSIKIEKEFNLEKIGPLTKGMDEEFQKYTDGNSNLSIDWDIWSGFSVTAEDEKAEALLIKIEKYLKEHMS